MKEIRWISFIFGFAALLLLFQNCGKSTSGKTLKALASQAGCSTDQTLSIPLEIFAIDQNFSEVAGITANQRVNRTTCTDVENGPQTSTFDGTVSRTDNTLFVTTNLQRKNGLPYIARFYKNEGVTLDRIIDQFCESDTSLITLSAEGAYREGTGDLDVEVSFNRLTVETCPPGKATSE